MNTVFVVGVIDLLLALVFAGLMIYARYRERQWRVRNVVKLPATETSAMA